MLGPIIGVAAMVCAIGLTESAKGQLQAQLAQLGTNLIIAQAGGTFGSQNPTFPENAVARVESVSTVSAAAATANLSGRVLADLILGRKTDIAALPCVNHRSPNWEPEPFRYLGVHYIQRAYWNIDRQAERTGVPPSGRSLAERLTRH